MKNYTYGSKRSVTGAHYGLRSWLAQRLTAVAMAIFTVVLLVRILFVPGPLNYAAWASIFNAQWMKFLCYTAILSIVWHVWVGMRDIWMDYVRHTGLRLILLGLTVAWLVGCAGWVLQVLWRL
jgi:succinate dehydrogenase / fumarate reductase membrane anchor subunit